MGYDDASQVTLIRHSKSDDTQVAKYEYSYNDAGVRTSVLEGNSDRVTWSYDNAWRLTREQRSGDNAYDITYSYDPVGSRATKLTGGVTTTYSYNAGDAVTAADAGGTLTTYSWDDAGNNTVVNANGTLTTYTWDGENRLKTIQTASGTITLAYDAGGLRRTRQDASTTRKYVWDFQNQLVETDGDGTTVAQYTGSLDTYGPIVSQRRSSTSRFFHPSVLGTIETLTGADGSTTDTYVLGAWGVQRASTGSTVNPFRYIGALGYYTEPDLGVHYVRARWLRPATGSWLSVDPVEGDMRYAYARGSPCVLIDPTGLWDWGTAKTGATAGAMAGATAGGMIGTLIEPGGGTATGLIIGGVIGAIVGGIIGGAIGPGGGVGPGVPGSREIRWPKGHRFYIPPTPTLPYPVVHIGIPCKWPFTALCCKESVDACAELCYQLYSDWPTVRLDCLISCTTCFRLCLIEGSFICTVPASGPIPD